MAIADNEHRLIKNQNKVHMLRIIPQPMGCEKEKLAAPNTTQTTPAFGRRGLATRYMPPKDSIVKKRNRAEKHNGIMTEQRQEMKHKELIKSTILRIVVFVAILFASADFQPAKAQENRRFFTFNPISEVEFRNALKNNYNAPFVTEIADSTKLEKAFESIEKTYNENEKELAESELCNSPRCLTSFKAYYPTLNLYLFYILDYHYEKASFVFASTNEMASGYRRFRGSYGVMSKDGLWVGLERNDCDNFLQMEICKSSKLGVWSLFAFDFGSIDINEEEKTAMFWADKNTIYIATHEYDQQNDKDLLKYYTIKFEY